MQLFIKIRIDDQLNLPLSYHHILQAAIYELASENGELSAQLHDAGNAYEKRQYKLFCFSTLHGHSRVQGKRICFRDYAYFELRSVREDFIRTVDEAIRTRGIRFGNTRYTVEYTKMKGQTIAEDCIRVKMISPLTASVTDSASRETSYIPPFHPDFSRLINENYRRKYESWFGRKPDSDISIEVRRFDDQKDEYATMYKNTLIRAWRGEYVVKGTPEALTFLYDTGIGGKNSQGFGMMEVVD